MNNTATLSLEKVHVNGKPAVKMVVRNADANLRKMLDVIGVMPDCTLANYRSIICHTPEELNAARGPLVPMFDKFGVYIGGAK